MTKLSNFTIILLICHFLGDFQLQSHSIAQKKSHDIKYLQRHIGIHSLILIYPLILIIVNKIYLEGILTLVAILLSHAIIDYWKAYITKKKKVYPTFLFVIDQLLHISIILLFSQIIFNNQLSSINGFAQNRDLLNWVLLCVLITKPANILFKIAFNKYDLPRKESDITESGAGGLIGNLERLLSVIFLSLNQMSAIGLIYTAKSIARFKQIEENKRFAEYYLIGTLYSILYSIIAYYLVMKI